MDFNQHEASFTAPDNTTKIVHEAVMPPGQPTVVVTASEDDKSGRIPDSKSNDRHTGRHYGMTLVWRGVNVLGVAIGIAATWYVTAWIRHGQQPLAPPRIALHSLGKTPLAVLPPDWLLAVVGLLGLISLGMMFLGLRDVTPKMNFGKNR